MFFLQESDEVSDQSLQEFQSEELTGCMASEPSCSSTPCCSSAPCCPALPLPEPDQNSVTRNKLGKKNLTHCLHCTYFWQFRSIKIGDGRATRKTTTTESQTVHAAPAD